MKINLLKFRQVAYALFILLIVICAVAVYYFVYADKQEAEINDRAFRSLHRTHENISKRYNTINRIITNNDCAELKNIREQFNLIIDSTGSSTPKAFSFSGNDYLITLDSTRTSARNNAQKKCNRNWDVKIKAKHLIKPFIREDVFDYLVVFNDKKIIYQDLGSECNIDSLKKHKDAFITINNESYKVYIHQCSSNELFFCGFKKKSRYLDEKFGIHNSTFIILVLVVLIIVMLFPLIKLVAMEPLERLKASTIMLAWIIFILDASLIFLLTLYYINNCEKSDQVHKNLEVLSEKISEKFILDIDSAYEQMKRYENYIAKKTDGNSLERLDSKDTVAIYKLLTYNFSTINCIDKYGVQHYKLSTQKGGLDNNIGVPYRGYFKNIINKSSLWVLPNGSPNDIFTFESIYSSIDGLPRAVISKPFGPEQKAAGGIKDSTIVATALSIELGSVINPVVPLGYGFAIIDEKGNVLFHNNKEKNLQENFLEECGNTHLLETVINGNNQFYTQTSYLGENCKIVIKPINRNIPFFLITYYNESYATTINSEVLVLCLVFIVILFIACCIHLFTQQFTKKRYEKIKQSLLDFDWAIPVKEKQVAYVSIIIFLLAMIVMLLFFSHSLYAGHESSPYRLLYLYVLACIFTFYMIYQLGTIDVKKGTLGQNKRFTLATILLVVIINFFMSFSCEENIKIVFFEVVAITLIIINIAGIKKLQTTFSDKYLLNISYKYTYVVLLLLWLVIISLIPTYNLYKICNYFGSGLELQQYHKEYITQKANRQKAIDADSGKILYRSFKTASFNDTKTYTYFLNDTNVKPTCFICPRNMVQKQGNTCMVCKKKVDYEQPNKEFEAFLNLASSYPLRKLFSDKDLAFISNRKNGYSTYAYGQDEIGFGFNYSGQGGYADSLHSMFLAGNNNKLNYCLTSPLKYFDPSFGWILRITAIYLVIIFLVLIFFIKKAFYLGAAYNEVFSLDIYDFLQTNVFLVTLPNMHTLQFLDKKLKCKINHAAIKPIEIDMTAISELDVSKILSNAVLKNNGEIIVVNHFEYDIANPKSQKLKVDLLKALIDKNIKGIIVISALHPDQIIEILNNSIIGSDKKEELLQSYEKWLFVFENFFNIYLPLQQNHIGEYTGVSNYETEDQECNNGEFLLKLKIRLAGINDKEEIILKVQELAFNYYHSIWNALSEKEKYIIYDLAQDGVINLKNRAVIDMLLSKGVIVINNGIKPMNESFRNFILTEVDEREVLRIENLQGKSAATRKIVKSVLLLLVLLIALWALTTQKEKGSQLLAIIASLGTSITLIINLFNTFNGNNKK